MSDVTESRWFKASVFLFSAVSTVVFGFNVYTFSKLNSSTPGIISPLTPGETKFLLIMNIILLVLSIILLIYSIWKLTVSKKSREVFVTRVQKGLTTEEGGLPIFESPTPERPVAAAPRRPAIAASAKAPVINLGRTGIGVSRVNS